MRMKLILLFVPLVILLATIPLRYNSWDVDFAVTPWIFFLVGTVSHFFNYNSRIVFLYSFFGLVATIVFIHFADGTGVVFQVNSLFYFLALACSFLFSIARIWWLKISSIFILLLSQLVYMQYFSRYVHNYANTGSFTGKVTVMVPGIFCGVDYDNDTICFNENKIYVLDFWFIGCGPCFRAFPVFEKFYHKYKEDSTMSIYSINHPIAGDSVNSAYEIIKSRGYSFPVLVGVNGIDSIVGIQSYPTVVILKAGIIKFRGSIELAEKYFEEMSK